MSLPFSFSSSSLVTLPGAFFSAVARAWAIVIFGFAAVAANALPVRMAVRANAVVIFLYMFSPLVFYLYIRHAPTPYECNALHKFPVNDSVHQPFMRATDTLL